MAVLPDLAEGDPLPSPESMRGKIIIKGKVVKEGEVGGRVVVAVVFVFGCCWCFTLLVAHDLFACTEDPNLCKMVVL